MQKTTRRALTSCAVITLSMCLCLSLVGVGGAALTIWNRSSSPIISDRGTDSLEETAHIPQPEEAIETLSPTPESTDSETPKSTQTPVSESSISTAVAGQMDQIQKQVIDLRGLQPKYPVDRDLLTPEQLRQKVINDFLEDYTQEEAQNDAISLAAFGLIDPDFNLLDFYIELFSEQVAGFYDDEAKKMYVVQGEGFQGTERLTYAHEYVHALQDQQFDLENGLGYNDEACEKDTERCAAIQALVEGDASFVEISWLTTYASNQDLTEIQQFYNNYQSPVYDSAPAFLKEDFVFPYLSGQEFVEYLHNSGGWQEVNQAYKNLPTSTEQILHPERYPDDRPMPVTLPEVNSVLSEAWQEVDRGVMGEWYTYLILAYGKNPDERISEINAQAAAEGWGGDAYVVYYDDQNEATIMILQTVWDIEEEAAEFAMAFQRYAEMRFGAVSESSENQVRWDSPEGYVLFQLEEGMTTWLLAPDQSIAQNVWEELTGGQADQ